MFIHIPTTIKYSLLLNESYRFQRQKYKRKKTELDEKYLTAKGVIEILGDSEYGIDGYLSQAHLFHDTVFDLNYDYKRQQRRRNILDMTKKLFINMEVDLDT